LSPLRRAPRLPSTEIGPSLALVEARMCWNLSASFKAVLEEAGIVFMFAPHHHRAMKHVAASRKVLRFRTVFNQLGPLANPAGANRQLIGVYDFDMLTPMAEAVKLLGAAQVYVAHSVDGLDEISPCDVTRYACIEDGKARESEWKPEDFGLTALDASVLEPGDTIEENASILREALTSADSLRSQALLPSASVALMLAGLASSPKEGVALAKQTIADGKALATLEGLVEAAQR